MQKFFRSGGAFFVAGLCFLVVGAASERPGVYIGLGATFLVLGLAVRKRNTGGKTDAPKG
jgi:hypothetical protein